MPSCTNPWCQDAVARLERFAGATIELTEFLQDLYFGAVELPPGLEWRARNLLEKYAGIDFSEENEDA